MGQRCRRRRLGRGGVRGRSARHRPGGRSAGLGVTGSIMQGNSVGQTVATGILGAATGGVGMLAASAGIGGKTGIGLAAGYTALDVGGGIGISGSFP